MANWIADWRREQNRGDAYRCLWRVGNEIDKTAQAMGTFGENDSEPNRCRFPPFHK